MSLSPQCPLGDFTDHFEKPLKWVRKGGKNWESLNEEKAKAYYVQ